MTARTDAATALQLGQVAVAKFRRKAGPALAAVVDLWADDIAQEVAIVVYGRMRAGQGTRLKWVTVQALRTIFGQAVGHRHGPGDTFGAVCAAAPSDGPPTDEPAESLTLRERDPAGVIALWRLQRLWPSLTEIQRAAIFCELTDTPRGNTQAGPRRAFALDVARKVDAMGGLQ